MVLRGWPIAARTRHRSTWLAPWSLERDTNLGSEAVGATGTGISVDINVPSMFYGAVVEALQAHQDDTASAYVGAFAPGIGSYFGPVIWADDAIDGPTSGIVVSNFAFLGSGAMSAMYGPVAATAFRLAAGTASVALGGTVPGGSKLLLVVTEVSNNLPDTDVTFVTRTQADVSDPGVWSKTAPNADTTSPTVAASLSGSHFIEGFVLVGAPMELD